MRLCILLKEGDRIGLMRKSNGTLHYYINDIDQGVASSHTPQLVWGVVDLYGMAVKVSIVDRRDPNFNNVPSSNNMVNECPAVVSHARTNTYLRQFVEDLAEEGMFILYIQ